MFCMQDDIRGSCRLACMLCYKWLTESTVQVWIHAVTEQSVCTPARTSSCAQRLVAYKCVCSKLGKSPSLRLQVELHLGRRAVVIQRQQCGKNNHVRKASAVWMLSGVYRAVLISLFREFFVLASDTLAASGKQPSPHR